MKKLVPGFLKKMDQHLLLNHPLLWISKIHYVIFYSLIMWAISAFLGSFIPINLFQSQDLGLWYFIFTIIAIVGLCFWIYYNVIFNIEKKFGKRHWADSYKLFFLYFITVVILMSYSFPFSIIYTNRVASIVTDKELIDDINVANTADSYIINDTYKFQQTFDSLQNCDFIDFRNCLQFGQYTAWNYKVDTIRFPALLSSYKLQKNHELMQSDQSKLEAIEDLHQVLDKYNIPCDVTAKKQFDTYKFWCAKSPVKTTAFNGEYYGYDYNLRQCLDNLTSAKFDTLFIYKADFLNFMLYMSFYISLLLLLFRVVNWKQYLVAAITCFLLPIIFYIITQFIPYDYRQDLGLPRRDTFYFMMLFSSFLIALFFTLSTIKSNRYFSAFKNICAQLVFVTIPFLPFSFVFILKEYVGTFNYQHIYFPNYIVNEYGVKVEDPSYYYSYGYLYDQAMEEYWRNQANLWMFGCLYGGLILFVFIIMPLMYHLFVKQIALPRKR